MSGAPASADAVAAFLAPDAAGRRFLFGRNEHSSALIDAMAVDGVIDDFAAGERWNGKPVIAGSDAPADAMIVNTVLTARPRIARTRIEELNPACALDYADLLACAPDRTPEPAFVADTRAHMAANPDAWRGLREALADEHSRQTLDDVLGFRQTARPECLSRYAFRPDEQYFDPIINLPPKPVFVDAGGYHGETTLEFINRFPDYAHVYFFEPDENNMEIAVSELGNNKKITKLYFGVSDRAGHLNFNAGEGSASGFSDAGGVAVPVVAIDDVIDAPVSMIKMDLEGWEARALQGARATITRGRPVLSIACYHKARDFIEIAKICKNIVPEYSVFLRHYTEGWTETIMYFVSYTK